MNPLAEMFAPSTIAPSLHTERIDRNISTFCHRGTCRADRTLSSPKI
jgi:hypothetical protein